MQVTAALVVFQLGPLYCCSVGKTSEGENMEEFVGHRVKFGKIAFHGKWASRVGTITELTSYWGRVAWCFHSRPLAVILRLKP